MHSRTSRLFLTLLALGFVLGAGGAALAQAQVTADDFNQFNWRWVGPVNFSGRITEFAVPPGAVPGLLRAHRERRVVENRGRGHALRVHF